MASLADLKKKSQQDLAKFKEKTKTENSFGNNEDNRMWKIDRDKAGNAFAIIRFLPVPKLDEEANADAALPWVKLYTHSFKNPTTNNWYIENSRSTINQPDPLSEANRKLWATGVKEDQDTARRQKRTLSYYSNIYVVKDGNNPENEGKVFLYRYGKKIFDKINNLINPDDAFGEKPKDPFNFWTGNDFKLKIRTVEGYANYDLSEFGESKPIADKNGTPLSDDQIEKLWEASYSLLDFHAPKNFKTYDELLARYEHVMNGAPAKQRETASPAPSPRVESAKPVDPKPSVTESVVDDDDIDIDALLASTGLDDD